MKDKISVIISILVFCISIHFTITKAEKNIIAAIAKNDDNYDFTIILDAGHGGEDSGTIGFDGTLEKDLNLQVTEKLALIFEIFGIQYIETRIDDSALGDTGLATIRERKVSDIHQRYNIINSYENSILLSIHQNYFPVEKYRGTQVFYASNEDSEIIASHIQDRIRNHLQNDNNRAIKQTGKDIYLLYNAIRPSVMVECGFMSNPAELADLKNTEYQQKISYLVTRGLVDYFYRTRS